MAGWNDLPREVRLFVWDLLVQDAAEERLACRLRPDSGRAPLSLASSAATSREWQDYFERVTFRRLVIHDGQVEEFAAIVRGRRSVRLGYIQHLRLHARLQEYKCPECRDTEDGATRRFNTDVLIRALRHLINTLATWNSGQPSPGPDHRGGIEAGKLVLELSAASPSDLKHMLPDFVGCPEYPFETPNELESDFAAFKRTMVSPRLFYPLALWDVNGPLFSDGIFLEIGPPQRSLGISEIAESFLGMFTGDNDLQTPRRVPIVQTLLIRLRYHRIISYHLLSALVSWGLSSIQHVHIEQWCDRNI